MHVLFHKQTRKEISQSPDYLWKRDTDSRGKSEGTSPTVSSPSPSLAVGSPLPLTSLLLLQATHSLHVTQSQPVLLS